MTKEKLLQRRLLSLTAASTALATYFCEPGRGPLERRLGRSRPRQRRFLCQHRWRRPPRPRTGPGPPSRWATSTSRRTRSGSCFSGPPARRRGPIRPKQPRRPPTAAWSSPRTGGGRSSWGCGLPRTSRIRRSSPPRTEPGRGPTGSWRTGSRHGPDALAANTNGQALALVAGPDGGQVLTTAGGISAWRTLATERQLAAGAGRSCGLGLLTAVGYAGGRAVIGGSCSRPGGVGLFAFHGGAWRSVGPALPAPWATVAPKCSPWSRGRAGPRRSSRSPTATGPAWSRPVLPLKGSGAPRPR